MQFAFTEQQNELRRIVRMTIGERTSEIQQMVIARQTLKA